MAALFLASKLEESPRRSRSVLTVFHHLKQRCLYKGEKGGNVGEEGGKEFAPLDLGDSNYFRAKEDLFQSEQDLLVVMGFRVHCRHPHKFMLPYARIIDLEEDNEVCLFLFVVVGLLKAY